MVTVSDPGLHTREWFPWQLNTCWSYIYMRWIQKVSQQKLCLPRLKWTIDETLIFFFFKIVTLEFFRLEVKLLPSRINCKFCTISKMLFDINCQTYYLPLKFTSSLVRWFLAKPRFVKVQFAPLTLLRITSLFPKLKNYLNDKIFRTCENRYSSASRYIKTSFWGSKVSKVSLKLHNTFWAAVFGKTQFLLSSPNLNLCNFFMCT